MKKSPLIFIEHILENINDIELFMKNINKKKFLENREKQNAVARSLEIIGEAVKNIPKNILEKYKKIPWKEISGTRDKLIHHYFGVDWELIYKVIKGEILDFKKEILKIKKELQI